MTEQTVAELNHEMGEGVVGAMNSYLEWRDGLDSRARVEASRTAYWEHLSAAERVAVVNAIKAQMKTEEAAEVRQKTEEALTEWQERVEQRRKKLEGRVRDLSDVSADLVARVALCSGEELFRLASSAGGNEDLLKVVYDQALRRDDEHTRRFVAEAYREAAELEALPSPEAVRDKVEQQRDFVARELAK